MLCVGNAVFLREVCVKRVVLSCVVLVLLAVPVLAQAPPEASKPALSEVQTLKAQVFALKAEVAQLRATLADREARLARGALSKEQADLAAEFLATVKAPAGWTWDWASMTAVPPKKEQ